MKTTIEEINGKLCTVFWHQKTDHEKRHFSQIQADCYTYLAHDNSLVYFDAVSELHIATARPQTPAPALSVDDAQVIEEMAGAIAVSYLIAREGGYRIMSQGDATEAAKAAHAVAKEVYEGRIAELEECLRASNRELWWCAGQSGFDWKNPHPKSPVTLAYNNGKAALESKVK